MGCDPIVDTITHDSPIAKLLKLPMDTYDVATISLVLSYLPSPLQRLQMLEKAWQLLFFIERFASEFVSAFSFGGCFCGPSLLFLRSNAFVSAEGCLQKSVLVLFLRQVVLFLRPRVFFIRTL